MAIRVSGGVANYMSVTAGLPTTYTAFTVGVCFRIDPATFDTGCALFVLGDAAAATTKGWLVRIQPNAGLFLIQIYNYGAASPVIETGDTFVVGTWYFLALSVAGTGTNQTTLYMCRLLSDEVFTYTGTANGTLTGAPGAAALGWSGYASECINARIAASRLWSVALTTGELDQHRRIGRAVAQLGSLVNDLPLRDPTLANNNTARTGTNWSQTGTLTVEDGPPIAWGGERQTMLLGVG